jgi:anti-anti-sigma factor
MFQPHLTVTVQQVSALAAVIHIAGDVNAAAENQLMDAFTQATSGGARLIVLNFSRLSYMNSSGIGLLVTLLVRANRQRQRLVAVGLSEHYKEIFNLTRLNEAICIFDREDDALIGARM